jgi:hypothetical protein
MRGSKVQHNKMGASKGVFDSGQQVVATSNWSRSSSERWRGEKQRWQELRSRKRGGRSRKLGCSIDCGTPTCENVVVGLEIAVHDSVEVQVVERTNHLNCQLPGAFWRVAEFSKVAAFPTNTSITATIRGLGACSLHAM